MFKELLTKLEELENANRQMQAGASPSLPRTSKVQPKKKSKGKKNKNRQPQQRTLDPTVRSSREPVNSTECPVEEWSAHQQSGAPVSVQRYSVIDNLGSHLHEAILIQEILGPPMCMRDEK